MTCHFLSAMLFLYLMFLRLCSPLRSALFQVPMTSPRCRGRAEQHSPFPPSAGEDRGWLLHRVPIPTAAPSSRAGGMSHCHPSGGAARRARAGRQVPGERRSQKGRAGGIAAGLLSGRVGCSRPPHSPRDTHTDGPRAGPGTLFPWERQVLSGMGLQGPS